MPVASQTPPTRSEIVSRARGLIGAPFQARGRTRYGIDCLGVVAIAYDLVGSRYDRRDYRPETARPGELHAALVEAGFVEVDPEAVRDGDLVTYAAADTPDTAQHAGVYVGGRLIHVCEGPGRRGRVSDPRFHVPESRVARVYRYGGLG